MKKKIFILCLSILSVLSMMAFTACGRSNIKIVIEFESNGGTHCADVKSDEPLSIRMPANPTRDGYTFDGWYWDNGVWEEPFTVNSILDKPLSEYLNLKLYAKWDSNFLTVTFYKNIGSVYQTVQVAKGDTVSAPEDPKLENSTFSGWYRESNYVNEMDFSAYKVLEDLNLYAKWVMDTNVVSFETNGGSAVQSMTIEYGNIIFNSPVTTKNQYIFDGWYSNAELTGKALSFPLTVTENQKLYAKWAQYTQGLAFTAVDGGYQVGGGNINASTSHIVIPSSYMGEPVIEIAYEGFRDIVHIQSVTIPDSIISIGEDAFRGAVALKSLSIPASVTHIGFSILRGCTALNSLTLPYLGTEKDDANTSYLGYFFGAADNRNNYEVVPPSLRSVTINGGTIVGDAAFLFCGSIVEIVLPSTLLTIGNSAFGMCDALETLIIPDGTRSIGEYVFHGYAPKLKTLFIPSSVVEIGIYAFQIDNLELCFERDDLSGMSLAEGWVCNTTNIIFGCKR